MGTPIKDAITRSTLLDTDKFPISRVGDTAPQNVTALTVIQAVSKGNKITVPAASNLNAGQPVMIISDGGVAKAGSLENYSYGTISNFTTITAPAWIGTVGNWQAFDAGQDKVLAIARLTNNTQLEFCVGTLNNTTGLVTWGTPVQFATTANGVMSYSKTNNFILICQQGSNNYTYGRVNHAGNTVTGLANTTHSIAGIIWPQFRETSSSTKFIILGKVGTSFSYAFVDFTNPVSPTNIAGGTIAMGADFIFGGGALISSDKYLFPYWHATGTLRIRILNINVAGNSATLGAEYTDADPNGVDNQPFAATLDTTHGVISYRTNNASQNGRLLCVTWDGSDNISFQSRVTFSPSTYNDSSRSNIVAINSNTICVADWVQTYKAYLYDFTTRTAPTLISNKDLTTPEITQQGVIYPVALTLVNKVLFSPTAAGTFQSSLFVPQTAEAVAGVALATVLAGASVDVGLTGHKANVYSGLTIGSNYNVNNALTGISIGGDNLTSRIGRAIASDTIYVTTPK